MCLPHSSESHGKDEAISSYRKPLLAFVYLNPQLPLVIWNPRLPPPPPARPCCCDLRTTTLEVSLLGTVPNLLAWEERGGGGPQATFLPLMNITGGVRDVGGMSRMLHP